VRLNVFPKLSVEGSIPFARSKIQRKSICCGGGAPRLSADLGSGYHGLPSVQTMLPVSPAVRQLPALCPLLPRICELGLDRLRVSALSSIGGPSRLSAS